MGLISKLFGKKKIKFAKIVVLGSSGAGKTTFIKFIESGKAVEEDSLTTLGIDVRKKSIILDNWSLSAIDVGGQELYQKVFWNLGLSQADAVVYLIDGTLKPSPIDDRYEISLFSFEYMLELLPPIKPIIILINKQDLIRLNPLSISQAMELYPFRNLINRSVNIIETSAKLGDGVENALSWLIEKISEVEE
jgi:small GTP-binding protein